jgi:hypothetical protein
MPKPPVMTMTLPCTRASSPAFYRKGRSGASETVRADISEKTIVQRSLERAETPAPFRL